MCREDICSADQAVQAVAGMLHVIAPNGDPTMAASSFQQVRPSAVLTCSCTMMLMPAHMMHLTAESVVSDLIDGQIRKGVKYLKKSKMQMGRLQCIRCLLW